MAKSYPSKHNNSGIWNMSDVATAVSNNDWCSGHRALFGQANISPGAPDNVIDYVSIVSLGDAADFGDLSVARKNGAGVSSFTRACFGGGSAPSVSDVIDYVTIASTGDAADFGDLTEAKGFIDGTGNSSVRGIFSGGQNVGGSSGNVNVIEYITMATTGDATDFGDISFALTDHEGFSSPTRGVAGGGYSYSPQDAYINVIDYIEITTTGNAIDFGDLSSARYGAGTASSHTRGIWAAGYGPQTNTIEYVTIPSKGNAINFGDLTQIRVYGDGTSNGKRAVFAAGGVPSPGSPFNNNIDYINISTAGDSADFGDLTVARNGVQGTSNGHGGLGL
jgi:hypothetical protein